MKNNEIKKPIPVELDEELLDAVSGGTSESETGNETETERNDPGGVLKPIIF